MKRTIAILLLTLLNAGILIARPGGPHIFIPDGRELDKTAMDQLLKEQMDSLDIPGLSFAIINDGKVCYTATLGVANTVTGEKVDSNTIFEAASLSKPLFAYMALKMAEEGLLDLDKPLYQYMPHPAIDSVSEEVYKLITARMVLSHSSGFPNWSEGEAIKLLHPPGEGFSYSGEAYQYLAAILGKLNGVGYKSDLDSVYKQEVGLPLRLTHSAYTWNDYLAAHKATGHKDGEPTDNGPQGKAFGAGYSLHTNAAEYARFLTALLQQRGAPLVRQMLQLQNVFEEDNHLKQEIGQTGWTLGFAQKPSAEGMMYMHTGNNHDFQSYAMILPDADFGVVLFTNSDKMEALLVALNKELGPLF